MLKPLTLIFSGFICIRRSVCTNTFISVFSWCFDVTIHGEHLQETFTSIALWVLRAGCGCFTSTARFVGKHGETWGFATFVLPLGLGWCCAHQSDAYKTLPGLQPNRWWRLEGAPVVTQENRVSIISGIEGRRSIYSVSQWCWEFCFLTKTARHAKIEEKQTKFVTLCDGQTLGESKHAAETHGKSLQALADAFHINQTVAVLNLSNNQIGDEGLKAIWVARAVGELVEGCRHHHWWSNIGLTGECLQYYLKNKICVFE